MPAVANELHEAYKLAIPTMATDEIHEVSEACYYEALGILPPVQARDDGERKFRFWVGEPYTHNAKGVAVCLEFWQTGGRSFCKLSECKGYR